MPLLGEPRVMYQNTSPSVADCTGPFASDGTFPDPCPLRPWQDAQFVENSFAPTSIADCTPADGFLFACADTGASWKPAFWPFANLTVTRTPDNNNKMAANFPADTFSLCFATDSPQLEQDAA